MKTSRTKIQQGVRLPCIQSGRRANDALAASQSGSGVGGVVGGARCSRYGPRKTRIKKPTTLQVILHKKNQPRSVYYFTHGRKIDADVLREVQSKKESPFYVPRDIQDFSYRTKYREEHREFREKARRYKYWNRPNHRTGLSQGKLERLFVPESSIVLPGKSVVDNIHPNFYNVVAGRPIREKFDIHGYLDDLKQLFLIRLQTGYRYDETYLMEEQYRKEKRRFREISQKFQIYSDSYDKFLAEDHSSSIQLLREADGETKKSKRKHERIGQLLRTCGWYRGKIFVLDEQWRISKIFQKFLYQISPLWWRTKYDYINKPDEEGDVEGGEANTQSRSKNPTLSAAHSVATIISDFLDNVSNSEPPVLYFQNPLELHHIFHEMEKSNLLALLQCEELTPPAQQMVLGLEKARAHFVNEVRILREHMKTLEDEVIYEENRSRECEQKAKAISFGFFKDLIVDRYTLNLYVNVEDCYEVCVAPNDSNLSLMMMMKGIEYKQESLMVALDNLPNEIVLKALSQCYREDAKMLKEAQEATKMITQIENLMKTLRKSLEPKREGKAARKPLWRSDPPKEKMDMPVPPNPLTKEQLDYLHFFTDFCPATDDPELGKEIYAKKDQVHNAREKDQDPA